MDTGNSHTYLGGKTKYVHFCLLETMSMHELYEIARDLGHKNLGALKFYFKWVDSATMENVTCDRVLLEKIGASIKKCHMVDCYLVEGGSDLGNGNDREVGDLGDGNLTQDGPNLGNEEVIPGPIDNVGPDLGEGNVTQDRPIVEGAVDDAGPQFEDKGVDEEVDIGVEVATGVEAETVNEDVNDVDQNRPTGLEDLEVQTETFNVGCEDVNVVDQGTGLEDLPVETETANVADEEVYDDDFGTGNGEESDYESCLNEGNADNGEDDGDHEIASNDSDGDADYIMDEDEVATGTTETAETVMTKGKRQVEFDVDDVVVESDGDQVLCRQSSSDNDTDTEVEETNEFHKTKSKSKRLRHPHLPEFRPDKDMVKVKFYRGLTFETGAQFKNAVREYAIQNGKDIYFKKNDPHRVRAKCKGVNCPWVLYASKIDNTPTFVVKTYDETHKCPRTDSNRFATSKWLAKEYLNEFKMHDKWGISSFQQVVSKEKTLNISRDKAYRARMIATKKIEGSYEEQYNALWDYAEEIKWTNKGSTVEILTDTTEEGKTRFKRMYICYGGLKQGFNEGCRPIIGLDGCHIKGVHPGQLLTAVGIDGNNQMYPVAFAVVEIENKDTWSWFVNLLRDDLKIENSLHWSFITDKQKGLEQALKGLWGDGIPEAEHRHCARHLKKNFTKVFKDKRLKSLLWKAAKSDTVRRFESAMEEIKVVDDEAYKWLMATGPHHWSRSHFRSTPKCDILCNNMCEGFNGTKSILTARDRPILTMLEKIRMYLMQRMNKNRNSVVMWQSNIAPKISEQLEKNKVDAGGHLPVSSGNGLYQVEDMYGGMFSVDLALWVCSCRKWELNGIPCSHAIAAIWSNREDPEKFVSKWYSKEYYLNAYSKQIFPIRNQEEWPRSGKTEMVKPVGKIQPGRPKKNRRLELEEIAPPGSKRLRRRFQRMRCSGCGLAGHNFRTCSKNNNNNV